MMLQKLLRDSIVPILATSLLVTGHGFTLAESEEPLPEIYEQFSLEGPMIFKVNRRSKNLMVEDLNGDGLLDIAVISNEKSIMEIFYQQEEESGSIEGRFTSDTATLDRVIRAAGAIDVNGDGRIDLVLAGSPSQLIVMYQGDDGSLEPAVETDLDAERLTVGDLNGDGREDLLIFSEQTFTLLLGEKRGLSLEPDLVFHTTGGPARDPFFMDFDGDGRKDIIYHDSNQFQDLVIRLQSEEKTFPHEFRVKSNVLRTVQPLLTERGERDSIITVQNSTRTLAEFQFEETSEDIVKQAKLPRTPLFAIPFDAEYESDKTSSVITDIDGDGRPDILLFSPELSVLRLLRQSRIGSFSDEVIPTFEGINAILPFATERGEPTPLILFSEEEKAISFTKYDNESKTLPFPRILPIEGSPIGIDVLKINEKNQLVVLKEVNGGTDVVALPISNEGELNGEGVSVIAQSENDPFEKANLVGMEGMDLNKDGKEDLVVYADFKPAIILLQNDEGKFEPLKATSSVLTGLLSGAKINTLEEIRVGEETLPVAVKEKFVRSFFIDKEKNIVVENQLNGPSRDSRLNGVASGSLEDRGASNIALLDRGANVISIYTLGDEGTSSHLTDIDLDTNDYISIQLRDLNGDQKDDFILTGEDRITLIYTQPLEFGLSTLGKAAPQDDDGGYGIAWGVDIVDGGKQEIIALEMKENLMEFFLSREIDGIDHLSRFYSFKVFDSESTIARRINLDALPEPRELLAVDVDDDGNKELITLIHDNIIVYRVTRESE